MFEVREKNGMDHFDLFLDTHLTCGREGMGRGEEEMKWEEEEGRWKSRREGKGIETREKGRREGGEG